MGARKEARDAKHLRESINRDLEDVQKYLNAQMEARIKEEQEHIEKDESAFLRAELERAKKLIERLRAKNKMYEAAISAGEKRASRLSTVHKYGAHVVLGKIRDSIA